MATPSFATEAAAAGNYPSLRFNQRERKLLASTKAYLDAGLSSSQIADGAITTPKLATDAVTTAKIGPDAVTNAKIADDAVSLEQLDSGIEYSHRVVAAGSFTTVGGDTTENIPVTGALPTDIAVVVMHTAGTVFTTVQETRANTDAIDVDFSGDPGNDTELRYVLYRAAS